jgi:hypothetical protein
MSMQFICTIQTAAAGSFTSAKSTSREPPGPKLPRRHPRRLALRSLLREVRLAADAVRVALERERPVAQVRDDRVADRGVVVGQVALGHAVARKQELVRARQAHAAAADLELQVRHGASTGGRW